MTNDNADDIDGGRVAQDYREGEKDPGEVGRGKRDKVEKSQAYVLVPPAPDIDLCVCLS